MSYLQLALLWLIGAFLLLLIVSIICETIKEVVRIQAGVYDVAKKQEQPCRRH